ncbi:MAG: DUF4145 domain-containing protein [Aphanocapsa feldmannii 277cV]|uniref:DUF4145 domain-containing protein n=1 Tax=Aphanocapsa feldmannii 277cV TaxID=2507553 RepID=A0A524RQY2_9CHRO|nr:MAG: DUF4145 domain-containing protein [Aphanocapsa feldmannii 277cV]
MPELVLHCPHCDTEKVGFTFGGLHFNIVESPTNPPKPKRGLPAREQYIQTWNTLFVCRHCNEGVVVQFRSENSYPMGDRELLDLNGDPRKNGFQLLKVHPTAQCTSVPEYVPDDLAGGFLEAIDNLRRSNFNSAGMMFRKILEQATLELFKDEKDAMRSKRLITRIDKLAEKHLLTPSLKNLAHMIRLEGNQVNHEGFEKFDKGKAEQMRVFTELFLTYTFTLPKRVEMASQSAGQEVGQAGHSSPPVHTS